MKYKKDVKVRREWGSQSNELLVINDEYVPEPIILPSTTLYFSGGNMNNSKGDIMRKCSDTSSTSDSEVNS